MKNKNIFISVTFIAIVLVGLVSIVRSGEGVKKEVVAGEFTEGGFHPARIENTLSAEEVLYDFGKISMKDGNVSKVFKVSNSSALDINLEKLTTSCMCTNAYILGADGEKKGPYGMPGHGGNVPKANEIIKAGETKEIEVVYDPNAHGPAGVGPIDRFVYLEDESGAVLQLEIKANVTP